MVIYKKLFYALSLCTALIFLPACTIHKEKQLAIQVGFIDPKSLPNGHQNLNSIRFTALHETALALGARGALAWRSQRINHMLRHERPSLDQAFDFNQLILKHHVLPPVVVEADDTLTLDNPSVLRTSKKVYRIVYPARLVTTPPTWNDYLWMSFKKPELPQSGLLPHTRDEARVWNHFLVEGWKKGLAQARSIFSKNLNRLRRDYLGIILFKKLNSQHIISSPVVGQADLGITGNENEIRIQDVITRITAVAELNRNSAKWRSVFTKGH